MFPSYGLVTSETGDETQTGKTLFSEDNKMNSQHADDESEMFALFQQAVWEVGQTKIDNLSINDQISSLGIDSVALMEVIGYLEEELEIDVSEEDLASVETVGDLTRVILRVRAAARRPL